MEIASLQASDDGAWSCEVILKACLCHDIDSDSDSEDDNDHDIGDSDDDHDDHGNGFDILTFSGGGQGSVSFCPQSPNIGTHLLGPMHRLTHYWQKLYNLTHHTYQLRQVCFRLSARQAWTRNSSPAGEAGEFQVMQEVWSRQQVMFLRWRRENEQGKYCERQGSQIRCIYDTGEVAHA